MKINCNSFINNMRYLLFILLNISMLRIYSDASEKKPKLIPMVNELRIEEGSELRISCYSNQTPLQFSFPEYTFMSPRSPHEILPPENGTWTFLRRNANFLDTGWYACAAEGVEIENHFRVLNHTHENIAWIYVYVSSSEPFADRYYTFPKFITAFAGSPAIVPCRPTSPDLDVELWRDFQIVELNEHLRFDPTIGFIMEPPTSEHFPTVFQCKVNGTEDRYVLYYSNATGRKPRINLIDDELFLHEGDELRIECYGESNVQFTFPGKYDKWKYELKTSRYEYYSLDEKSRTFYRSAVLPGDTGWYGCAEEGIDFNILPFYIDYTRKEINWIYVYVESNTNKLLQTRNMDHRFTPDTSMLVPCRPTSSKLDVRLKSDAEILDENVRFYPKLGFIIRRSSSRTNGCYTCVIHRDDVGFPPCANKFYPNSVQKQITPAPSLLLYTGDDLHINCSVISKEIFFLEWNTPSEISKKKVERSMRYPNSIFDRNEAIFEIKLMIKNVMRIDSGQYNCTLRSARSEEQTSIDVYIYDRRNFGDISSRLPGPRSYTFTGRYGQSFELMIDMGTLRAMEDFKWLTPAGTSIGFVMLLEGNKYKLKPTYNHNFMVLEICNLNFDDTGLYRVFAPSGSFREINVTLDVQAPPTVTIEDESKPYYPILGETFEVSSNITGSPMSNITWSFDSCPNFPLEKDSFRITPLNQEDRLIDKYTQFSTLKMSTNTSGILTCTACNFLDCSKSTKLIVVSDGIGRFAIIGPNETAYLGDDVVLTCAGSKYAFQNLTWNEPSYECDKNVNRETFYIEESQTKYTIRSVLRMKNVTECQRRSYVCQGKTEDTKFEYLTYYLNLSVPQKPDISRTNLQKQKIYFDPDNNDYAQCLLVCCVDGEPIPNIIWFKDNLELKKGWDYDVSADPCTIIVRLDFLREKGGRYTCRAENRFGQAEDYVDLEVREAANDMKLPISAAVVILILIFVIIAGLVIRKHHRKISRRRLQEDILKRFEMGALDRFNPDMDIVDQAEVLPYDEDWEYPRHLLKLGKILGKGAFGIVRKAEAKSIRPGEPVTTVAVKMVHATSTLHHMMALSRELKVLVHLGQDLNIVNLLGACTKNVSYGELFVIVEFCRFGNLQDYLSRHRDNFVDEVDPNTGEINAPDLGTPRVNVSDNFDGNSVTGGSCRSRDSMDTSLVDENGASSAAVLDSGVRSKYDGDYVVSTVEPIRTKDLVCWAWQVSRGMKYLGDRKVVHGDLAARNILLADNNVIKICDFGLAKALYKADHYKMAGGDPLPLKWMPIEAINDLRFSIESDVWSFGIVLWELFSLAEPPYPGIHPRYVYQKLLEGYRMDKPKYAPKIIYRQMMKCWEAEPANRPSFPSLEIAIHELLEDSVQTYYMDLSNQYNDVNTGIFGTGKKDYLTMDPSQIEAVSFSVGKETVEQRAI